MGGTSRWGTTGLVAFGVVALAGCQPIEEARVAAPAPDEQVTAISSALALTGFEDVAVITGLTQPSNVEFAPDGKVFVAQRDGRIFVYDGVDDTTPSLFADLRPEVYDFWDRGLLGLAIDPAYPVMPFVYVLYTLDSTGPGSTIPRWNDTCPTPPGATDDGCVATARLARLEDRGSSSATTGSETVLIEGWGQQYPSHSIGTLAFGADGALYVSAGEGASFNFADWGQDGSPVNPLADPPGGPLSPPTARGGALRAQSLRRPTGEPVLLNGAILRVDKMTGAALPDNPLAAATDPNARRIVAYGLRNPFRFTIHPTTGELWIGDVGWGTWEEIDRVVPRTAPVENLGWPCYEGAARQSGYDGANLTLCEDLYATALHVPPHYTYNHANKIVTNETCSTGSSSISGVAFYQTGTYPADYQGALFFADYSRRCIWVMRATGGVPDPTRIANFVTSASGPVDLQIGPGGDLFYVDLTGGNVRRVRYRAPNAVATATPMAGAAPLAVTFSGTGSTGVAGEALTYAWDLDGDGDFDDAAGATASLTYAAEGTVIARLRVTDTRGVSDLSDPLTIQVGPPPPPNTPPTPVIETPVASTTWVVGTTLTFTGSATDPEDGPLPASALTWELFMMHCPSNCHAHLVQTFTGVAGGSFVAPDHEYPSHLEIRLTATDSRGAQTTTVISLEPQTVVLTLASAPVTSPPLQIGFGPSQAATPFTRTVIIGSTNSLSAPDQLVGSTPYTFASWSDSGAASHNIVAPATATTYTATYAASAWASQDIGAVAATGSLAIAGSTFTLRGSGADIWGNADELRYAYQTITGDATITARVASLTNTNGWAKAGVMMRDGLGAGARYVAALVPSAAGNLYRFQTRTTANGTSASSGGGTGAKPAYVRVNRTGNVFRSYWSTDGVTFTQVGASTTLALPGALTLGLAVSSHADGTLATATFDNVTITAAPPPPPPPPPVSLYLEAESATLTAPLQNLADAAASGGRYVAVTAGSNSLGAAPANGRATWTFTLPAAGLYRFWGRVINPNTNDDSWWARVDGGTWIKWNDVLPYGAAWQWIRLHDSNAGNAVVERQLTAGAHTLEIAYREDGARLDRVFIANSSTATP